MMNIRLSIIMESSTLDATTTKKNPFIFSHLIKGRRKLVLNSGGGEGGAHTVSLSWRELDSEKWRENTNCNWLCCRE